MPPCFRLSPVSLSLVRLILLFLTFAGTDHSNAQLKNNITDASGELIPFLVEHHVEPPVLNDSFSRHVFDKLLNDLDPDKIYFTQEDIRIISPYKYSIDDDSNLSNWPGLAVIKERYKFALQRAKHQTIELARNGFEWNTHEPNIAPETWEKDDRTLYNRRKAWLKSNVLIRIGWYMERDSVQTPDAINRYAKEATEFTTRFEANSLDRLLSDKNDLGEEINEIFFRAITTVFDPHTAFLSTTDFRQLKGALSTEGYYFGFSLDDLDDGKLTITSLAPGGPAWRSGQFHIADEIVSVQQNNGPVINLAGLTTDESTKLLDQFEADELNFELLHPDGIRKNVKLKKEKLRVEESSVRSFILQGDKKIGYIHLPDFYTQWDDGGIESRAATDVAMEIVKLIKDKIDGLILDVRFNGGGSTQEALAMAGIFIDQGPLCIAADRTRQPVVLKDMNRGTIYDGPLALLVNSYSASASELLAAALQDYNRAIIIGGQTYGKATMQRILPLKKNLQNTTVLPENEPLVKVTTERIYRITGGSIQGKGITPDITLPEISGSSLKRESEIPFSLKPDSVAKKTYYRPLPSIPKTDLQKRSLRRIEQNPAFSTVRNVGDWNKTTGGSIPITWKDFFAAEQQRHSMISRLQIAYENSLPVYKVETNSSEAERLKLDTYATDLNKHWTERLLNDIHVKETYNIILDYIALH